MISDRTNQSKRHGAPIGGTAAVMAALLVMMPAPAFAYVDPGTGSILWQMLLGLLVGAGFYFRQIAGWVTRKQR